MKDFWKKVPGTKKSDIWAPMEKVF